MRGAILHAPGDVRVEDRAGPDDRAAHRRDHPRCPRPASAARTCGPTAASSPSTGRPRWATSTSASSRRSAATSAPSSPASSSSARSSPPTTPARSAGPATRARCVHRELMGADRHPGRSTPAIPLADGTLVATPERAARGPGPQPAGRLRRAGHRLVRRRRRRRAGPGKTVAVVGDGAVGLLGVLAAKQLGAERIIAMSRHEPRQTARPGVRRHRHRHRTRRRRRRGDQGPHQRAGRPLGDRGRRHPGIDDAGHPVHPPRRPRRLRRRLPRRRAARRGAVLLRGPPARRPRPGTPLPARADRADLRPGTSTRARSST